MLNSPILDVAISMVFIFFLFSVLTSAITELIVTALALRGKDLRWALEEIFNDPNNKNWSELMYDHPLIDGLKKTDDALPSYISAEVFSMAIIDVFIEESKTIKVNSTGENVVYDEVYPSQEEESRRKESDPAYNMGNDERSLYNFKEGVRKINPSDVQTLLKNFIYKSKSYDELIKNIQNWYNEYMDRSSGWYKKKLRYYLFAVGFLIAVFANVDSIRLTNNIYKNKDMRDMLVMQAENYVKENKNEAAVRQQADSIYQAKKIEDAAQGKDTTRSAVQNQFAQQLNYVQSVYDTLDALNLPIGWKTYEDLHLRKVKMFSEPPVAEPTKCWCNIKIWWKQFFMVLKYNLQITTLMTLCGWIFTAFALSMGAPFWFETLNKLVNMRNAGKKPEEKTN